MLHISGSRTAKINSVFVCIRAGTLDTLDSENFRVLRDLQHKYLKTHN